MGTGTFIRDSLLRNHEIKYCGRSAPDPTKTRLILLDTGLTISEPVNKAVIIGGESVFSGYSRGTLGTPISSISANTINTTTAHNLSDNTPFFIATQSGGTTPTGLSTGTRYYARSTTTTSLQASLTSGGSALSISGGSSNIIIPSATYDATDVRAEVPTLVFNYSPTVDSQYQGIALITNGDSTSGVSVTSINTSTDQITCSAAHNRTTGDQVVVNVDSGGTQPSGISATTVYYCRVVSSTVLTLHPTAADASGNTNTVDISSSGSGTIRVRFANGDVEMYEYYGSPQSIFNAQTVTIQVFLNIANIGNNSGV